MQRIVITAVLAASFAGAALAESRWPCRPNPSCLSRPRPRCRPSSRNTRRPALNPWSSSYNPLKSFRSAKTRAEVTAEYIASRDEVHAFTSEDSGSEWLRVAAQPSFATRSLASR